MPAKSLAYLQVNKLPAISWELAEEKDSQARNTLLLMAQQTAPASGLHFTSQPPIPTWQCGAVWVQHCASIGSESQPETSELWGPKSYIK